MLKSRASSGAESEGRRCGSSGQTDWKPEDLASSSERPLGGLRDTVSRRRQVVQESSLRTISVTKESGKLA